MIEFNLVLDGDLKGQVSIVNPQHIETIVDGMPLHKKPVTQICTVSGARFFVDHPYLEVKKMLNEYTL